MSNDLSSGGPERPSPRERVVYVWQAGFVDLLLVSDIEFVASRKGRRSA